MKSSSLLLVDDDPRSRALLRAWLGDACAVEEAEDGHAALRQLQERKFDLVLLDVMMPGLDGFEVCRRIKEGRADYLPVLMLTALGDQEQRNRGLLSGADDFLTKPVDRRELTLRVQNFLKLKAQEDQIRAHADELRRIQQLKDDLVTLIVHDLRNPLQGVVFSLNLFQRIAKKQPSPTFDEMLARSFESTNRMQELLDDVLRVRNLESDELELRREEAPLAEILGAAARAMTPMARGNAVPLELVASPDVRIHADGGLMRRVVENLIGNAVKYSPEGQRVTVTGYSSEGDAVIDVCDRGPGVPEALRGKIFEKFGCVEAHRGEQRRGYGLGLYFVKLVVERHGGKVSVLPRDGEGGSVFRVRLPIAEARVGAA